MLDTQKSCQFIENWVRSPLDKEKGAARRHDFSLRPICRQTRQGGYRLGQDRGCSVLLLIATSQLKGATVTCL